MALTRAELAAGLQIDPALVTRYRARGMPDDSVESAARWKRENVKARVYVRAGERDGAAPQTEAVAAPKRDDDDGGYWANRGRRERAEADLAELKLAELRGELLRREVVERMVGEKAARTREAVLQVKGRLAPLLAAESDVLKVAAMLDAELRTALEKGAA